jgi:hypothetical protein
MTRMLGFFPDDGVGDWALPDGMRTHISERLSVVRVGFVFMEFVCFLTSYFAAFGKIMFRCFL